MEDCSGSRDLGFTESVANHCLLKHSFGVYWHIGIIRSSNVLKRNDVITALKILVQKQEVLQMRIVPTGHSGERKLNYQYKLMEDPQKIDIDFVTFETIADWPIYISRDHDTRKIDCLNGPLWRCVLCHVEENNACAEYPQEYVFLLKFHHAIIDGKSAFDLLYRQFLPILSAVINGTEAEKIICFVPHTKSVEEMFMEPSKRKNPVPWYLKWGIDLFRWKTRICKPQRLPTCMFPDEFGQADKNDGEPICVPRIFDQDICKAVIKSAKHQGVTVHSIMLSAGSVAFSETAEAARVTLPNCFSQAWPIDLRKFLNLGAPEPLGNLHLLVCLNINAQLTVLLMIFGHLVRNYTQLLS